MAISSISNLNPSRNSLGSASAATRPPTSQPPCDGNSRSVRKLPAVHAVKPNSIVKFRTGRGPARIACMALSKHATSDCDDMKQEQMASPRAAASWVALSAVASVAAAGIVLSAHHAVAAEMPAYSGVDDSHSELVQGLLKKSTENKKKNDQDRLDRFYKKEFAINKLLGTEVLPEACDPRDPEFGGKCLPRLPRLPEDRLGSESRSPEFQGFGGLTPMEEPDMFQ